MASRSAHTSRKDEVLYALAEVKGKVIASCEIARRSRYEKHVGALDIVIKKDFRDLGIGTEMMYASSSRAKPGDPESQC